MYFSRNEFSWKSERSVLGGEELNYTTEHFRSFIRFCCSLLLSLSLWPSVSFSFSSILSLLLSLFRISGIDPSRASSKLTFIVTFYPLLYPGSASEWNWQDLLTACLYYCVAREGKNGYLYSPFPQAAAKLWAKFPLKQWLILLDWIPGKLYWTPPTCEWVRFP